MPKPPKARRKALLLGVGLDSDGHKRVTTGPNFALVGGAKATHEAMTEQAVKINEKLKARGKELHQLSRDEFDEIAASVGLHRHKPHTR
jgi:hypothetical protein